MRLKKSQKQSFIIHGDGRGHYDGGGRGHDDGDHDHDDYEYHDHDGDVHVLPL